MRPADVTLTSSAMRARVTADVWVQLFDRDNDGTVDEVSGPDADALGAAIASAQSIVAAELAYAYPEGFAAAGGSIDDAVIVAAVQIALYEGARYSPLASSSEASPFRTGYNDAMAALKRYREGLEVALTTSAGGGGPTFNNVRVGGTTDSEGNYNRRFGRTGDGSDGSLF